MASGCYRLINRTSFSSIKAAIKTNCQKSSLPRSAPSSPGFTLPSKPSPSPLRRFSLSRSPSELGCIQSLLPLHSAVSAARMTSCLSTTSRSCRALSQELGLSVPR